MAEREGFEPSVEVLPLRRFSKPLPSATRPPLHWSQLYAGFPIICGAGDDRRNTSKRAVILPQAMWEVQAIREVVSRKTLEGKQHRLTRLSVWFTEVRAVFRKLDESGARLRMLDRSWLCAASGRSGEWFRVTEFNMAGSDDAAGCQHVQHGSFLSFLFAVHSAQLYVVNQGREDVHHVFLRC